MIADADIELPSSRLRNLEARLGKYADSVWLGFDSSMEIRYQEHQHRARLMLLQGGLLLSASLLGGFLTVDGIWLHHYPLRVFLVYGGILVPLFVFALLTTLVRPWQRWSVTAACVVLAAAGLVVAWAPVQAAGLAEHPPYMFGSCLIFVPFAYFFSGALFSVDAAIAVFFSIVCLAFQAASGLTAEVVLTSFYLLAAINSVGAVGRYLLERTRRHDFLAQLLVRELADHDSLTGLHNRRVFRRKLEKLLDEAGTGNASVTLLLLDIDHFKQVNDGAGHAFGDAVLQATGSALAGALRIPPDFAGRLGGDEFGLVWVDLGADAAQAAATTLQLTLIGQYAQCASTKLNTAPVPKLTVSIGVATITRQSTIETVASLMHRADVALYAAKHAGRAQVVVG